MKIKSISLGIILLATLNSLYAQGKHSLGFKAALTLSNPSIDVTSTSAKIDLINKIGFTFGGFFDLIQSDKFTLQTELYYSRKIVKADYNPGIYGNPSNYTHRVDYMIYGVSFKYNFIEKDVSPYVYLEPRLNFYLGDKSMEASVEIPKKTLDLISERMTKLGFGINLGGGVDLMRGTDFNFFLEVQFCPDFFNAFEDGYAEAKSNSIEFRIGYGFGL